MLNSFAVQQSKPVAWRLLLVGFSVGLWRHFRPTRFHSQTTSPPQPGIELFWGPYLVIGNHSHNDRSFKIQVCSSRLNDEKVWPRSKIKELRTTFYEGQEMLELKLGELRARGITLPDFGTTMGLAERGSADSATPYHDLIEALDYYPPFLLMNGGETH